jgi:hypothetical protein
MAAFKIGLISMPKFSGEKTQFTPALSGVNYPQTSQAQFWMA